MNDLDFTTLKFCNRNYKTLKPRYVKLREKYWPLFTLSLLGFRAFWLLLGNGTLYKIIYTDYIFQNAIITLSVVLNINLYKPPAPWFLKP